MTDKIYTVLLLCTGNSARSIMAECLLNRLGKGRFRAHSAGSHPRGRVHPYVIALLRRHDFETDHLYSKDWSAFAGPDAPVLDFVFTVCDKAASEVCPVWPGQPMSAHWGVPDPVAVDGSEAEKHLAFKEAFRLLQNRIGIFVSLPLASIDRFSLKRKLDDIGRARADAIPGDG